MFFPSRAGFFKSSVVNIPFVCDLDEDDRTGEEGRGGVVSGTVRKTEKSRMVGIYFN